MCSRLLCVVVFALSLFGAAAPVSSQVIWQDGRPIFPSERRTYRPRTDRPPERPVFQQFPRLMSGGPRPYIEPQQPATIALPNKEPVGTVIIDTEARALYLIRSSRRAYRYPISVGREGFTWTGTEQVSRIADWPDWHPPKEMRQRQPGLPVKMTGGISNPLGAKAIYLGNTLYRIHGTNDAATIGQAASSGCFRMLNSHVVHLANFVRVGTTVKVVHHWKAGAGVARTTARKQKAGSG
jgi:lipoprotein-anchoring transpeptidase ErfK/SrfK